MHKSFRFVSPVWAFLAVLATTAPAQAQGVFSTQFAQAYGTSGGEAGYDVLQTSDGGFLAVGDQAVAAGEILAIKTDANGNVQWQQTYDDPGGAAVGIVGLKEDTVNGGFIIGGNIYPSPLPASANSQDGMMIKIDAAGTEQWRAIFGGSIDDFIFGLVVADDGGFVAAGGTDSPEIENEIPVPTDLDVYAVKVSSTGTIVRQIAYRVIGGNGGDQVASDVAKTTDGGYMLAGESQFEFLLKLDANLDEVWNAEYGTTYPQTIEPTSGGGFVTAGNDLPPLDATLVKYEVNSGNPAGPLVISAGWPKSFGRSYFNAFNHAVQTVDGGYIATGSQFDCTDPDQGLPPCVAGRLWVAKLDANGDVEREGVFYEAAVSRHLRQTSDGGYIVVGNAENVPLGPGGVDFILLKLLELPGPGFVAGTTYFDTDETCSVTLGDVPVGLRLVKVVDNSSNAAFLTISDSAGNYAVAVPPGNYKASLAPNALNNEPDACGPNGLSYQVAVTADVTEGAKDFLTTCTCQVDDELSGEAVDPAFLCPDNDPSTSPCPGHQWTVCYDVTNPCDNLKATFGGGPAAKFAKACIDLPPGLIYDTNILNNYTITPDPASACNSAWTYDATPTTSSHVCFKQSESFSFVTNCEQKICFPVDVDNNFLGGSINAQFTTDTIQCPAGSFPPTPPLPYGGSCACDPNAMHVTPEGCGASGNITSQELTYRVDFQNLGTGPAHKVIITDALDAGLDFASLHVVSSSHTITALQMSPSGELVVRFDDIVLPPEVDDAEGSKGFVTFTITPVDPFNDGDTIENTASIVFDANVPVVTNTVTNTLYHGDPVPVVDFTATPHGLDVDFTYTGGTTGATFAWDFGTTSAQRTSQLQDPIGVPFNTQEPVPVLLVVDKAGCTAQAVKTVDARCDAQFTETPFRRPMGKKRYVGQAMALKFELSYNGQQVTSQAQLDGILTADFGYFPSGDCWPKIRVFNDDLSQELSLDPLIDFINPQNGCYAFANNGRLRARIRINPAEYVPASGYRVFVDNFGCFLTPGNNRFETKP